MLKYKLRRARATDARIVRKLLLSILTEHGLTPIETKPDEELVSFGLGDPLRDDFVAVSADKIVGFLVLVPALGGAGEVSKLFVARSHRGRGVGTMLIERAMEAAKMRGYASLRLSTVDAFASACAYYERRGWVRESAADAASIRYAIQLREVPRLVPPAPPLLRSVLSLLDRFTRLQQRLERELAGLGEAPRRTQHDARSAARSSAASNQQRRHR